MTNFKSHLFSPLLPTDLHKTFTLCCIRQQLQQKEAALAEASAKLADIDGQMHSLAAKYDKTLARLAEDRQAVRTEEAEREAEAAAVASSRAQAAEAQAAAEMQQSRFNDEVSNIFDCSHEVHTCIGCRHVVYCACWGLGWGFTAA